MALPLRKGGCVVIRALSFGLIISKFSLFGAPLSTCGAATDKGVLCTSISFCDFTRSLNALPNDCIDVMLKFDNCESALGLPPSFNVMFEPPIADTWYALATPLLYSPPGTVRSSIASVSTFYI